MPQGNFGFDFCLGRIFNDAKVAYDCEDVFKMKVEDATNGAIPFMFASFASLKDPEWKNHPGRANKRSAAALRR